MSHRYDSEEYEDKHKIVEFFLDEENTYDEDYTGPIEFENEEPDNIYNVMQALKQYSNLQALPLCQYLNFDLLTEFLGQ